MKPQSLILLYALAGTLCCAQTTLIVPGNSTTSGPANSGSVHAQQTVPAHPETTTTQDSGAMSAEPPFPSSRFAGALTDKSEFHLFAESSAGRALKVYGREIFYKAPATFAPLDHVPVPTSYVIGPGDELLIRAWGKIDLNSRETVDRNGQISLPKVGTISLAGVRNDQLETHLRNEIGKLYKDFEINVTLGRLRSIQVYVLGSARQPGAYTVSSFSTLVSALFASGGPSATGSMRHVQLRRGDSLISDFDLYDLLRKGDTSHDVQLLPGDVIYIPPVGPQIAVIGSINEPGIFELRGETSVGSALQVAGGLTSLAGMERAVLERIEEHRARRMDEFGLDQAGLQRVLKDGDLLRVLPLSPKFENAVTLRGNVSQPGRYAWRDGMRVSDLIPTRDFLITRKYWNEQNKSIGPDLNHEFGLSAPKRMFDGGNELESMQAGESGETGLDRAGHQKALSIDQDRARLDLRQRSDRPYDSTADSPLAQSLPETTARIDSIGKNSAEINWEYAVIERLDDHDLSTKLIPFRLASAIDDHASADNQVLRQGDTVTVFSRSDLDLPMEKHSIFVRVGGEVGAPGMYRVDSGDTLRDLVRRTGGLTPHSYLYASLFTRRSTLHAEEDQLRQSSERMQRELVSRYANSSRGAAQSTADQQAQLALQQSAISRLASIKPTGRVVLQIKPTAATVEDIPDFPLEDGDTFYIPPRLSTVQVTGSVYNANAFRHQPGKTLIAYLNDAGGPTREADKRRIFVIRADGTVISRQGSSRLRGNFEKLKLLPGDAIIVPERFKAPGVRAMQDLAQIISQSTLSAAALRTVLP